MRVRVNFYGVLKEDVGTSQTEVELSVDRPTIDDLATRLESTYPELASRLATTAFAVDSQVVDRDFVLNDNAQVDLLPPVSGGLSNGPTIAR